MKALGNIINFAEVRRNLIILFLFPEGYDITEFKNTIHSIAGHLTETAGGSLRNDFTNSLFVFKSLHTGFTPPVAFDYSMVYVDKFCELTLVCKAVRELAPTPVLEFSFGYSFTSKSYKFKVMGPA